MVGGEGQGQVAQASRLWEPPALSPKPPPPIPYVYGGTGVPPVHGEGEPFKNVAQPPPAVLSEQTRESRQFLEFTENRLFKDPIRILLDSRLRLPLTARLLHLDSPAPTWVACTEAAPKEKFKALKDLGAEVLVNQPRTGTNPARVVAASP